MISKSSTVTDMLTKFDDSKRAVANLMARENITCQVVDGAETAKFNPTTRVLIVPNWTGLTTEQCDLLMSHEIGHALFTDRNLNLVGVSRGLFSYYNIIEDARIERRMKGAFPGLAPTFYKGYREFHTNGPLLKGTADALYNPKDGKLVPFAKMRLIDRINMHYKIGAFCAVPFSVSDKAILARVDKCTSSQDCLALAKELFKADKNDSKQDQPKGQDQPKPKSPKQPKSDDTDESDDQNEDEKEAGEGDSQDSKEEDSDSNESDGDKSADESDEEDEKDGDSKGEKSDEDETDENDESAKDSADSDESDESDESSDESDESDSQGDSQDGDESDSNGDEPSADTDTDEALKDIASKGQDPNAPRNTLSHILYPVLNDAVMKDRVITAHDFTTKGLEALKAEGATAAELDRAEAKWNAKYLATAKHMALEFERRKSAKNLQNAITGRTGKLDLSKLAGYRFTEDLFKRSITVPNGKSHGIVMLIDGSGSMQSCFAEVIDQVLLFAHFAFIVNIPFEAYMFSDNHEYRRYDDTRGKLDGEFDMVSQGINALTLSESGRLIGLVNTTTNRAEFKKNCQVLLAVRSIYSHEYGNVTGAHAVPHAQLSGTPLFQGVMIAERLIARMKTAQKLDKTTFVVITDGEDTNGIEYETNAPADPNAYHYGRRNRTGNYTQLDGAFVVRDAVTKKNLSYVTIEKSYNGIEVPVAPENAQLTMLLDVMKLRHDTRTVYIYLQAARGYSSYRSRRYGRRSTPRKTYSVEGLSYLVRAGKQDESDKLDHSAIINTMKEEGQYVVPTSVAVADLAIILPVGSVQLTEDTFSKLNTDDMTQKKVAAEFTKAMVNATSNRKFVNSVVPHLI